MACSLTFLGSFAPLSTDGKDLPLPTRSDRLLLAYLALSAFREARESADASGDEITRNALEAENLHHWFTRMPWSEGRSALRWSPAWEAYLLEQWRSQTSA